MYKLSIVIPVYNNYNFTKACLNDLFELPSDHQIIVVDNGSSDSTRDEICKLRKINLFYIRNNENKGFGYACNQGYEIADGKNVMFLNNDIRVKSNKNEWTNVIIKSSEEGFISGPTGGVLDNKLNFIKETNKIIESKYFYMSGWNLTANKQVFNKLILENEVGPFSTEFGLAFFEDTDLSFRASKMGLKFRICDIPVHHFGHMTSNKLNTSKLYNEARKIFVNKWEGKL